MLMTFLEWNLKETTCWVEWTIQMVNYRLISLALTVANVHLLRKGANFRHNRGIQ